MIQGNKGIGSGRRETALKTVKMLIAIGLDGGGRKAIQVGEYPSIEVQC